jgi:rRNA maturation RNase YbeY
VAKISTLVKKIFFHSEKEDFILKNKQAIRDWIAGIIVQNGFNLFELNYIFVTDERIFQINAESLDHHYYTDIITFHYHEPESKDLYSDIYISIDSVIENAKNLGIEDWRDELHRVMIHGVLHLLGFDDHSEENIAEMRKQEENALSLRKFL